VSFVRDIACVSGIGLAIWGLHMIYEPVAYIAAGAVISACSIFWSLRTVQ
jgi:hypothetical protein